MQPTVHVFTDRPGTLGADYLVTKLAWHWEQRGFGISCGPSDEADSDLGILHFDQTKIPAERVPANGSKRLLNGTVLDISKRTFSTLRVFKGDSWDGPVIIKTDLNAFGCPEWGRHKHGFFERKRRQLAKVSWELARTLPPRDYPVLATPSRVPGWVWESADLIVERFLPERAGDLYCLRGWVFFGSRSYTYRLFSAHKVVKAANMARFEFLPEPPPELETFRADHGFDFGKFDYVMLEDRPILLDINKTPTTVTSPDTPRLRNLAEGIDEILEWRS